MQGQAFRITYDDGLRELPVIDTFIHNQLNFSGKFFSTAAVIKITHVGIDSISHYDAYFIGTKPAKIIFSDSETMQTDGNFKYDTLVNAIEIYQSKIKKQRDAFIKTEADEITRFSNENAEYMFKKDSLTRLFYKKIHELIVKDIDFIKKNGNEYFSFWWFKTQILTNTFMNENATTLDFKDLLNIYNTVFPSNFTGTPEGQKIKELLTARISTQVNSPAPNFETKDVKGNKIKLTDFKGRYVLLDFWATWCAPCMAQLPFIKKIRDDYSDNQLVIISISSDADFRRFEDVVKEKKMNWIHIFGNNDIPVKFGVNAIPVIFLIDKNGIIIFNEKGNEKDILKLLEFKRY